MECQKSDCIKMIHAFDTSKRNKTRKKRDGDDDNSLVTDDSTSGCHTTLGKNTTPKASKQNLLGATHLESAIEKSMTSKRDRDSSPSLTHSSRHLHRVSRSPRRHRRQPTTREGDSLALRAGKTAGSRSGSIHRDGTGVGDPDSMIYAFLEEAVKREKRKQRHTRHSEHNSHRDREPSTPREHHRHHRRRRDSQDHEKTYRPQKEEDTTKYLNTNVLFETFAKLCTQLTDKNNKHAAELARTQSHKSLQCEVMSKKDFFDINQRPVKLNTICTSQEVLATPKIRSMENVSRKVINENDYYMMNNENRVDGYSKNDKYGCDYSDGNKELCNRYSKHDCLRQRADIASDHYRDYNVDVVATRSHIVNKDRDCYKEDIGQRDYRDYDYDREKNRDKKPYDHKINRSYDIQHDHYIEDRDNRTCCRRTVRSDLNREREPNRRCDDIREKVSYSHRDVGDKYEERNKFYEDKGRCRRNYDGLIHKDHISRRNLDSRFERNSVCSRDEYKERERYSERERDSGLSVADGETSVVSTKSNYLRVVKQEIAEQRETMDKMMQLWKELMRCFKGMSQNDKDNDVKVQESAANARNSAVEQLKLWRECMRRYETVARDVGDTDARLMEEINKQRSEMAEMATMWQECLQRYRDMSNDFNSLKQQLAIAESPSRIPAVPLVCAEGEGLQNAASYRMPPGYPAGPPPPPNAQYPTNMGSPLRSRASVPPTWWWYEQQRRPREASLRRRSSPESRGPSPSRERDRRPRHRERDRDAPRCKESSKSSKPNAARPEHRNKKR